MSKNDRPDPPFVDALATGPEGIDLPPPPPVPEPPPIGDTRTAGMSTTLNPRLAPQDIDAERSVLGGILLQNDAFFDVSDMVKPEDFYREPHRKIYRAMHELINRNEEIDVITLGDELRKMGELEAVGGPAYISALDSFVPATANLKRYAKIVLDAARLRRTLEALHSSAMIIYENKGSADALLAWTDAEVSAATSVRTMGRGLVSASALAKVAYSNIDAASKRPTGITGLRTGIIKLDRLTSGFKSGQMIGVGGRPGSGKSSLLGEFAAFIAAPPDPMVAGRPVAVFSQEMTGEEYILRLMSNRANIPFDRLQSGRLFNEEWSALARATDALHKAPLFINETSGRSILDVRADCRKFKREMGDLAMVGIDYCQLLVGTGKEDTREEEIAGISRGIKALAKELECPIIALSQLNRGLERRDDKRPMLSDLRESGAIEQDCDIVMFTYSDSMYSKEAPKDEWEIIVGKQRNGATGTVRAMFKKPVFRFENMPLEPGEQEEMT